MNVGGVTKKKKKSLGTAELLMLRWQHAKSNQLALVFLAFVVQDCFDY